MSVLSFKFQRKPEISSNEMDRMELLRPSSDVLADDIATPLMGVEDENHELRIQRARQFGGFPGWAQR
ncbi:MAG: hypothetical protein DMG40_08910 [Acidobacteria bacterium]|nr:MAG: hypothetical protein DMG40_08910 [Acidobacteriota bacterium]